LELKKPIMPDMAAEALLDNGDGDDDEGND